MGTHSDTCCVCNSEFDPDCGGTQGYFGIIPVVFCEWCLAGMVDMVRQMYGLNDDDDDD